MAKVYLEPSDSIFRVNDNNVTIYGANENQIIILATGVTGVTVDQNVEEVVFEKTSADYTYEQNGNQVKVYLNGVLQAIVPVQGDPDGTKLTFANGSASATLNDGVMTLGGSKSDSSSNGSLNPTTVLTNAPTQTTPIDTGGGGGGGGGSPTPTFAVTNTAGVVTFDGTATGDITFTMSGTVATFSRGGLSATTTVDFSSGFSKITVSSGQTLSATAAQVAGKSIDGAGSVAVTALESALDADLSGITSATATAAVATVSGAPATFGGNFGKAAVTTSGDGTLDVSSATMGTATFSVALGTTLQGSDTKLGGVSATGAGSVEVISLGASTDLSALNSALNVTAVIFSNVNISSNSNLATVDAYMVAPNKTLTMSSSQADAKSITGATGNVTITGASGNETLNVATTGTNSITGGAGADNITLGSGEDILIYASATPSVTETHTLYITSLTTGRSSTIGGLTLTATGDLTTLEVANGFANLSAGATTGNAVTNGVWSGALSSGWSSGAVNSLQITFTSQTPGSNVSDISTSSAGVDAPTALSDSATQGAAEVTAATEIHALTFPALIKGQSVTVDGLTLTATGNISAEDVAAGFANLDAAATTGNTVTNGTWSGGKTSAWTTAANNVDSVWFVSATPNSNVPDITFSSAGISAPAVVSDSATQGVAGVAGATETHTLSFSSLLSGQSATVAGLTLTALSGDNIMDNGVATAFAGLNDGATAATLNTTNGVEGGVWSGTLSGWSSASSVDGVSNVTFVSATPSSNVPDIAYSGAVNLSSSSQGAPATAGTTETHALTFQALTAGQSVTVDGLTLTATGSIAANAVAAGFASLSAGAATGNSVTNGTWSGALTSAWHSGTASSAAVTFTSENSGNVTDIAFSSAGVSAPSAVSDTAGQGAAAVIAATETHALTFQALSLGQSVTVGGLTLTATGSISAADVAAGFASLAASAANGNTVTNGIWSGTLSSAWHSGTASAATVTFTSQTADSNVTDIAFSSAGVSAPTAPFATASTQGSAGSGSSDSSPTAFDVVTGFSSFDAIKWSGGAISKASAATAASGTAGLVGDGAKATFDAADTTFALHLAAIEKAIQATSNTAGEAAHWQEGADAYVFISDGSNGVGDGDILIKLVGVDLTNAANDVITIVSNNLTLA